jgi:hypothetical protein
MSRRNLKRRFSGLGEGNSGRPKELERSQGSWQGGLAGTSFAAECRESHAPIPW